MIILDTSFIISFYNIKDENHKRALKLMQKLIDEKYGEICLTDYIFDECVTVLFIRLKDFEKTVQISEVIKKIINYKVDEDIFEGAWNIFREQKETKFSFTDCTILALMQEKRIMNIATFDEDFKKNKEINVIE